jgi:hypothetical protein
MKSLTSSSLILQVALSRLRRAAEAHAYSVIGRTDEAIHCTDYIGQYVCVRTILYTA